tara:strand:- start:308 stop:547 length:240 start_codon:yes stop_codon:yes gene_type:complete
MQYNKYNRKTLIQIIKKREASDYRFLFDECFNLLQSIVGNEQKKRNYDYDESLADFNDCVNKAEWTKQALKDSLARVKT